MSTVRVLLAGESWVSSTTHFKGWDFFSSTVYDTGLRYLEAALRSAGVEFTYIPNHLADVDIGDLVVLGGEHAHYGLELRVVRERGRRLRVQLVEARAD
ncbi:MAG: hypothetical protein DCC68_15800, partial [Planctomycetota bacterium]